MLLRKKIREFVCFFCFLLVGMSLGASEKKSYEELDQTLIKLVSFQTVPYNEAENVKQINWIKEQLKGLPLYFEEYSSKGHPSLVITTQKTKSPKLWLIAHLDVVPADPSSFTVTIENGKMMGRGVLDMVNKIFA